MPETDTTDRLSLEELLEDLGQSRQSLRKAFEKHQAPAILARKHLQATQQKLDEQYLNGHDVRELVGLRSANMDLVLSLLWDTFDFRSDACLVAVGGYGRAELHPHSDIDLLILSEHSLTRDLGEKISSFITLLWDLKLDIGHSVRSIEECISSAREDVTIATNLLETRTISGSDALRQHVSRRVYSDEVTTSEHYFLAKREEQRARHEKYGGSEYNLEPNLKSSPGTLRDIQTLAWITKRHFGVDAQNTRSRYAFLTDDEFNMLVSGETFLWKLRYGLQMIAERNENRLLFDHQKKLAEILGYQDAEEKLGVEQMMQYYYRIVMGLAELTDVILQFFEDVYLNPQETHKITPLNKRFQLNNGYIEAVDDNIFDRSPYAFIEIFLLQALDPSIKGIRSTTIRQMRKHKYLIDDHYRQDLANTSLFLELLRTPHALHRTLNDMLKYNVLGNYLPEMGKIVGQMQHDLFHIYTVDAHTIQLIKGLVQLAEEGGKDELALAGKLIQTIPKRELLYIAALYHDIAKGRGGDHSELGAIDARAFCERHHFGERDTKLVCWLVEHHLLMSMTAQRKDIADPEVIQAFAREIPSISHLEYLYVLTVCDIAATNPSLWNSWRASLLQQLFVETRRALRRGIDKPLDRDDWIKATREEVRTALLDKGYAHENISGLLNNLDDDYFLQDSTSELVWQTASILDHGNSQDPLIIIQDTDSSTNKGFSEIMIYLRSNQDLFAATTAVLEQLNLNVLNARISATGGAFSLSRFVVTNSQNQALNDDPERKEYVRKKLIEELDDPEDYPEIIQRRTPRQLKHFLFPTEVTFSNDTIKQHTIMEVVTPDRPGLLARIGQILLSHDLLLLNARITTLGERVEDVFFLTQEDGQPLCDGELCRNIADDICRELDDHPQINA
ncbi:MAG: [protein-PII] uridylyltransferase [Oleiphilus sp.]|nr:MAG: [protein-PII] uridylyltransferase [Oleiphilus sp.]